MSDERRCDCCNGHRDTTRPTCSQCEHIIESWSRQWEAIMDREVLAALMKKTDAPE